MKPVNFKYTVLHYFKNFPQSTRKKLTRYLSIVFVAGSMVLFFFLSKRSTVDTQQIVAEWNSSDVNNTMPAYNLLEQKWMRVEIAFKYLKSLNSSSSIQKQIAVNEVMKAQADMTSQIQSLSAQPTDANTRRFIQLYSTLLSNNKSLLAATVDPNQLASFTNNKTAAEESNQADALILKDQLAEQSKEIENLKAQIQQQNTSTFKNVDVQTKLPDANTSVLKNQLAEKNKEIASLKSQLQKQSKTMSVPAAESVDMFDYKSKNIEELQKQVRFFDWALKDMTRQNNDLKKENQDLKNRKVLINQ